MMSSQFFCFFIVTLCIAGGLALNCSQCFSVPNKPDPICFDGVGAVKTCAAGMNHCVLNVKILKGNFNHKSMFFWRQCARFPIPSSCEPNHDSISCTKTCNSDGCNLGMISPGDFAPSTTTATTTTSTMTTSSSEKSNATRTEPTTIAPLVECYTCKSKNDGNNCTTNASAVGRTEVCGPDKPYCTVTLYVPLGNSFPGRYPSPPSVIRQCDNRRQSFASHLGALSIYSGSCRENLCNDFPVNVSSPFDLVPYYRSRWLN